MKKKPDETTTRLSLAELRKQPSRTDWQRVAALTDAEITAAAESDPDALPLDDAFFEVARRMPPAQLGARERRPQVTLRVDAEVLAWYKSLGKGYQSKMNAVLKAYVRTHTDQLRTDQPEPREQDARS